MWARWLAVAIDPIWPSVPPYSTPRSNVSVNLRVRRAAAKVSYDGPDHLTIRAYASSLNRVVINLVENAIRYGGGGLVRLVVAPDSVVIAVEDDGPGIPDGRKEARIEPFVCGDVARGMEGRSGFGLGLSIARAVAVIHGGSLTLLDRKPTGLIARIELPAGATSKRQAAGRVHRDRSGGQLRIA